MKSVHFLALAVVAVLGLGIGYFVGAGGQGNMAEKVTEMVTDDVKAVTADVSGATSVTPEGDGKVLATVNGEAITEQDIETLYASLPAQYRQAPIAFVKEQLLDQLISMEVIGQAAEAENLDSQAEFKDRLDSVRTQLMQEYYLKNKIEELVTDEMVRAEYDKVTADFTPEQEVHARHILLKNAEEATDVIKLLDDGGDFAELAKEYSTGPSGPNGGDLGFFTKERMVPEFATAAFAMDKGTYSKEPVQTQFGFHVIKVEDKRDTQPPAYEQREEELRGQLTNTTVNKLIEDLKTAANIEIIPQAEEENAENTEDDTKKE
ncbi:MAG: peptidylprolyl isomerase [Proteobacteria bacterium]|nr:peptidylprolyl isomerase [Pseudomonadota bacterium]